MAWITPKTDWNSTDYFNADDYNRISNNLSHLKNEFKDYFGDIPLENMPTQTIGKDTRVSEFSALPHNLYRLNNGSFKLTFINDNTYYGNTVAPNYEEWNKIEEYSLFMYNTFYNGYVDIVPRLAITLNGRKPFGKHIYKRAEPKAHRLQFRLGTKNGGSF